MRRCQNALLDIREIRQSVWGQELRDAQSIPNAAGGGSHLLCQHTQFFDSEPEAEETAILFDKLQVLNAQQCFSHEILDKQGRY